MGEGCEAESRYDFSMSSAKSTKRNDALASRKRSVAAVRSKKARTVAERSLRGEGVLKTRRKKVSVARPAKKNKRLRKRVPSLWEAFEAAGLVGCIENAPRDLSEKAIAMEHVW